MTRPAATLALLLVAGCGGKAPPPSADPAVQPVILADEQGIMLGDRPHAQSLSIKASPVVAWRTARRVYEALAIPVALENPATHQIGNKDFWKMRAVGPLRMAELVDCGTGITGRKADSYRIYMSLITTVSADAAGGTLLQTTLIPFGQDVTGGNSDRIPCGSTGRLEAVVNETIRNNAR